MVAPAAPGCVNSWLPPQNKNNVINKSKLQVKSKSHRRKHILINMNRNSQLHGQEMQTEAAVEENVE